MTDRNLTTTKKQVFGDVKTGTECRICGRNVTDGRSKYCSQYCKDIATGVMSLLNWTPIKRRILERDDYTCQNCGFRQAWLYDGYAHLQEIVESKLPEEPESPSMLRVGKGEVSDEELAKARREWEAWNEQREELVEEYFRVEGWSGFGAYPSPENRLEVDHIEPIADGGHPFDPANLETLCEECHQEKTVAENRDRKGRSRRPDVERELADFVGGEQA